MVLFARNTDPVEGQLTPSAPEELTAAFGSGQYTYIERSGPVGSDLEDTRAEKEYWVWALGALLVLLATETFLARKFGHW